MKRRTKIALGVGAGVALVLLAWWLMRRRKRKRRLNAPLYEQELQAPDGGVVFGQIQGVDAAWVSTFRYATPDQSTAYIQITTWPSPAEAMHNLREQYAQAGIELEDEVGDVDAA